MKTKKTERYRDSERAFHESCGIRMTDHYVAIKKIDTRVRVQVWGEGEPVLFIPGGPNCGTVWTQLVDHLPHHRCMLLDRPGTGLSDPVSYRDLDDGKLTDLITTTISGVLAHFGLSRVTLVGSSFGGYWALKFALHRPGQVNRLVLEGCPAFVEGFVIPPFLKMMTRPIMRWLIPRLTTTMSFARKLLVDMGHAPEAVYHTIPELYFRWYISMSNHTITVQNDIRVINKTMKGGQVGAQYYFTDHALASMQTPTLWLWGKNDPFASVDTGKRVSGQMKNSRLVLFDNSGHLPWLDAPAEHARILDEFFRAAQPLTEQSRFPSQ